MSSQQGGEDHSKKMQIIGMVLLFLLFGGWLYYQSLSYANLEQPTQSQAPAAPTPSTQQSPKIIVPSAGASGSTTSGAAASGAEISGTGVSGAASGAASGTGDSASGQAEGGTESAGEIDLGPIVVETDVYRAELSPQGAVLRSLILKQHDNDGQPLEMVRSVDSGRYPFAVYLGSLTDGEAIELPFSSQKLGPRSYRFRAEFSLAGEEQPYILEKTLTFAQAEYMVQVRLRLRGKADQPLPQNARGVIYSLYYGPQMGPVVDHIGSNRTAADLRSYVYFDGKKSRSAKLSRSSQDKLLDSSPIWAGINGKYFGVLALPNRNLQVYWSAAEVPGLGLDASGSQLQSSQFLFERRAAGGSLGNLDNLADDTFYYYIGPLLPETLSIFNKAQENEFGLADASLNSVVKFSLGFIEEPVKWILLLLYSFTHNYGIAIILFALIVRILLYPLSLKSFHSTSRMRLIQPQMKEMQEKYKKDPKRLQQEMAQLYRKEKVNPVGGCLPLLVQMPILIAIANLFYRYFELRGATFIPGWISDLSAPDLLYKLELGGWELPLRLLPAIYLGSQLVSSKLMQAGQPPMQNKMQQRMFTIYMPIFFSVILYNMPSGLILYWTVSNVLMTAQQLLMNRFLSKDAPAADKSQDSANAQQSKHYRRHTSTRGVRNDSGGGNNKGKSGGGKSGGGKSGGGKSGGGSKNKRKGGKR